MDTQKCGNKEKLSILKARDNLTAKLEIIKIKTAKLEIIKARDD